MVAISYKHKMNIMKTSVEDQPVKWVRFTQFLVLLSLVSALYYPSIQILFSRWLQWDQDLSHGLPTIIIFLFLVWRSLPWPYERDTALTRISLLIALAFTSVTWFLFYKINIQILSYVSILVIFLLLIACCYSIKTAKHLVICWGVLFFAVPIWGHLNAPLAALSAHIVGSLAQLTDLSLLMEGNNIFTPYGRLYIDDGCSGLRYFVIALLMAYLISYLNNYRYKKLILTFLVAIVLALITNWIRIFSLVVIAYQTEMKSSLMTDHELFGWILFAIAMLPAIYFAPVVKSSTREYVPIKVRPLAAVILLALGPALVIFSKTSVNPAPTFSLNGLDELEASSPGQTQMDILFPDTPITSGRWIIKNGLPIKVSLAQYIQTAPDKKLVPYFRALYDRDAWLIVQEIGDNPMDLHFSILKRAGTEEYQLLAHQYHVGRYTTEKYGVAKLLQIPAMLLGDSYFIIYTAQVLCENQTCDAEITAVSDVTRQWLADPITKY